MRIRIIDDDTGYVDEVSFFRVGQKQRSFGMEIELIDSDGFVKKERET